MKKTTRPKKAHTAGVTLNQVIAGDRRHGQVPAFWGAPDRRPLPAWSRSSASRVRRVLIARHRPLPNRTTQTVSRVHASRAARHGFRPVASLPSDLMSFTPFR